MSSYDDVVDDGCGLGCVTESTMKVRCCLDIKKGIWIVECIHKRQIVWRLKLCRTAVELTSKFCLVSS
jgi:hypothetical protein